MPTREQIEAELAKLPPEQHAAFLAEVEKRMAGAPNSGTNAPDLGTQVQDFASRAGSQALKRVPETLGALGQMLTDALRPSELGQEGSTAPTDEEIAALIPGGRVTAKMAKGLAKSQWGQMLKAAAPQEERPGDEKQIGPGVGPTVGGVKKGIDIAGAVVPVVGPMAADYAHRAMEGEAPEVTGDVLFDVLTAVLPGGVAKKLFSGRVAGALEKGAVKSARRVVDPSRTAVMDVEAALTENPEIIKKMGVGGTEKVAGRIQGATAEAGKKVGTELAGVAGEPVDYTKAISEVQKMIDDAELTLPDGAKIPLDEKMIVAASKRLDELKALSGERALPPGHQGPPVMADAAPVGDAVDYARKQQGIARKKGFYDDTPGVEKAPEGEAAATTARAVKDIAHEGRPAYKAADKAFSQWSEVNDAMQNTLRGFKVSQQHLDRFTASGLGRAVAAVGLGGLAGKMTGLGSAKGAVSAAGAYAVGRSAFWNSFSAQMKRELASAIRAGAHARANELLNKAAVAFIVSEHARKTNEEDGE